MAQQWQIFEELGCPSILEVENIYYERGFPIEIRSDLAKDIEDIGLKHIDGINMDNMRQQVINLQMSIIKSLEIKIRQFSMQNSKRHLVEKISTTLNTFQNMDQNQFVSELTHFLLEEQKIIAKFKPDFDQKTEIYQKFKKLEEITFVSQEILDFMDVIKGKLISLQQANSNSIENWNFNLFEANQKLQAQLYETFKGLEELLDKILEEELGRWKNLQKFGKESSEHLDFIQDCFEKLRCLNFTLRKQIIRTIDLNLFLKNLNPVSINQSSEVEVFKKMMEMTKTQLLKLLSNCLVVVQQPARVHKLANYFSAKVRLLIRPDLISDQSLPVTIELLDNQMQLVYNGIEEEKSQKVKKQMIIELKVDSVAGNADYFTTNIFQRKVNPLSFKRSEKILPNEKVMELKYCLRFTTQFRIIEDLENAFDLSVSTLTLPLVIGTNGAQDPNGEFVIAWDNYFGLSNRKCFTVPDSVPWKYLSRILSNKFKEDTKKDKNSVGRGLDSTNLHFLAQKIFKKTQIDENEMISRKNLWSDKSKGYTFCEWFYEFIKLSCELELWSDGLIVGFVDKDKAKEMLVGCPDGTFIIRYSNTVPGGVTFTYSCYHPGKQETLYLSTIPTPKNAFTLKTKDKKWSNTQNLIKTILDIPDFNFLYPNIPKFQAFGKYWDTNVPRPAEGGYGYDMQIGDWHSLIPSQRASETVDTNEKLLYQFLKVLDQSQNEIQISEANNSITTSTSDSFNFNLSCPTSPEPQDQSQTTSKIQNLLTKLINQNSNENSMDIDSVVDSPNQTFTSIPNVNSNLSLDSGMWTE